MSELSDEEVSEARRWLGQQYAEEHLIPLMKQYGRAMCVHNQQYVEWAVPAGEVGSWFTEGSLFFGMPVVADARLLSPCLRLDRDPPPAEWTAWMKSDRLFQDHVGDQEDNDEQ